MRDRADDAGLILLDAEVVWIRPGPQNPDHLRIIDAAAAIGARNVLTVSSDPNKAATAAKLGALADHARAAGPATVAGVRRLHRGEEPARRARHPGPAGVRVGADLLIDALHLARTGGLPEDVARLDPVRGSPTPSSATRPRSGPSPTDVPAIIEEAIDGRSAPGEGALPLEDLLAALPAEPAAQP